MAKEPEIDKIFNAILAKNQLAREIKHGYIPKNYTYSLVVIEEALAIAMDILVRRDNQPSVKEILESKFDV